MGFQGWMHGGRRRRGPECEGEESFQAASGRDYLDHLPGTTYVTECGRCGRWFPNPAPPPNRAAQLYPADYRPYAKVSDTKPFSFPPFQARCLQRRLE